MIFDYENLRLVWWLLLGVLLIGFAVMDGFDLGVAALLPFVGRSDVERRVAINTIGPVWDGSAWHASQAAAVSGCHQIEFPRYGPEPASTPDQRASRRMAGNLSADGLPVG